MEEIKSKLKGKLVVTANSTLVLNGNLSLGDVHVDGSLKLEGNAHFSTIEVKDKKYD